MDKCAALVLAAGKGTRMHSDRPKVLATILGSPMLLLVCQALRPLFGDTIFTVTGHGAAEVEAAYPEGRFILQQEQLGTGHALGCALPELEKTGVERVLVVNGDAPLITTELMATFLEKAAKSDLAFMTATLPEAGAYGRVVRDQKGQVLSIVEAKDYDDAIHGAPTGEINVGCYLFSLDLIRSLIPQLSPSPVSGEYYITDLVALALKEKRTVMGVPLGSDSRLLGVNSPLELSEMEEVLRAEIVRGFLEKGVTIHAPSLVRIAPQAIIEPGCELTGPLEIYGNSVVRRGAVISSHCLLRDSEVDRNAEIRSFSHLEGAYVGPRALVGPYARLRPGAHLEENSHVGNFVELKKTRLGKNAKANHLTYLGDAEIGQNTNIGAGTITCNYDGKMKHRTVIGEEAFIGSNTALVAPVTVGDHALIGAGSTITHDVKEETLSVARAKQKNFPRHYLPS